MTRHYDDHDQDGFHAFYTSWSSEQNQHLDDLIKAAADFNGDNLIKAAADFNGDDDDHNNTTLLTSLVEKVIQHYEQYYNAKFHWINQEVLSMLSPPWRSSLEYAFLWIGGWRPSMAFHLLYSKLGLQPHTCFDNLIEARELLRFGNVGELSDWQLETVDEMQRRTIEEEKRISEKMAKLQETLADNPLVELSHLATDIMRQKDDRGNYEKPGDHDNMIIDEQVESNLGSKEEGLEKILHKADGLRMTTLKNITEMLSPLQGVHFLIAAAELHLRVHEWGKKKDELSY